MLQGFLAQQTSTEGEGRGVGKSFLFVDHFVWCTIVRFSVSSSTAVAKSSERIQRASPSVVVAQSCKYSSSKSIGFEPNPVFMTLAVRLEPLWNNHAALGPPTTSTANNAKAFTAAENAGTREKVAT